MVEFSNNLLYAVYVLHFFMMFVSVFFQFLKNAVFLKTQKPIVRSRDRPYGREEERRREGGTGCGRDLLTTTWDYQNFKIGVIQILLKKKTASKNEHVNIENPKIYLNTRKKKVQISI